MALSIATLHATWQPPVWQTSIVGASLKDVAARAGVSPRTVSNVVNDRPQVAPETRRRVQEVLEELDYRPNLAARNLRGGRSGMVGLVVPELDSPYFSEIAALVSAAAEKHSWTVLTDGTRGDVQRERRLLQGARDHLVDGLILSPWALTSDDLLDRAGGVPMVLLGEHAPPGQVDHVAVDNVAAAAEATAHLIALGRRRVAAVGISARGGGDTSRLRLQGYRQALATAGLPVTPGLEVAVDFLHRSDGARAMHQLLDGGARPDALFCFTDQLALGAMRVALQSGLDVPGDLAITGFDDIEDGRYATPSLSTVSPDKAAIATWALSCLAERISKGKALPARRVVIEHRLLVRESSGG